MKTEKELVIDFAKTWNNLDISFIQDILLNDFHYSSQLVFKEIENKEDYLNYLEGKFKTIKKTNSKVIAELGIYDGEHCLVLKQTIGKITQEATFLIKTKGEKISRADICMIPSPKYVKRLGIIPK